MDTPFPPPPAGLPHPDPVQEQARLHRMLAAHCPPAAPFGGALGTGSFHPPAAGSLTAPDAEPQVKLPFTFAF